MSVTLNGFAGLKAVRATLKEDAQRREAEEKKRQAEAAKKRQDDALFMAAMSELGVRPVEAPQRAQTQTKKPIKVRMRLDDRPVVGSVMRFSDELDATNFVLDHKEAGFYRRGMSPDLSIRLARGEWRSQSSLDLHGLTADAAREALGHFLKSAVDRELRAVTVVHGRSFSGQGRLRTLVPRWLKQCDSVMAYSQAGRYDGDDGAVRVLLRVRKFDDEA